MNGLKEKTKEIVIAEKFIRRFVEKEFSSLTSEDKERKTKEILVGFEGFQLIGKKAFIVGRLPEGGWKIFYEDGDCRDFDKVFLKRR